MGSNSESARKNEPLTVLSLCDRLQNLLVENGMEDAPITSVWYDLDDRVEDPMLDSDWKLKDGKVVFG